MFTSKTWTSSYCAPLARRDRSFYDALKKFIFVRFGEGMVDIAAVVSALHDHRYDGWLVVEQDTTPLNPTTIAMENRVYLETVLNREKQ